MIKGKNNGCFIIAEAGVNHNGDLNVALKLCDAAKECGADAIKFQTWITEELITNNVPQASYQTHNTGIKESQFDMLKKLELSFDDFKKIKEHCDDIGIIFCSTADEKKSLDFLLELGVPFVKIGSGDIGNIPFLRYIGSKKIPVILSTGMSNISDIDKSVEALEEGGATDITILHCTTAYPCPLNEVNLKAMLTIGDAFHYPVGYSDHTKGIWAALGAVALGATIIEKHFTLNCEMEGPDQIASTDPEEFKLLVESIRNVESCLGNWRKKPTIDEKQTANLVKKRIVCVKEINIGDTFTDENISIKRNSNGLIPEYWDKIIGKKSLKHYNKDEGIEIFKI